MRYELSDEEWMAIKPMRFSTRSSIAGAWQLATTSSRPTTSRSSNLRQSGCGCALMSPHSGLVVIDVAEREHLGKLALVVARKTTFRHEFIGVAISAEQAVPERNVGVVVVVYVELVVHRVQLGRLDEILQPARRLEVGVIEELAGRCEEVEPQRAFERAPEHEIQNGGRKRRVRQDLDRVLVERRDGLDPRRRVMHLMEDFPEALLVANAMPPVEKERADEPADEAFDHRHLQRREVKQRRAGEQLQP